LKNLKIGIDIGGTYTRCYLLNDANIVLAESRQATPKNYGELVDLLVSDISKISQGAVIEKVGIGIPGTVDSVAGTVANAVNLGIGATPFELADLLKVKIGVPVKIFNDVSAAALGAHSLIEDEAKRQATTAYIGIGTGIGVGLLSAGVPLIGAGGTVGEYGHIRYGNRGLLCKCGQTDCLELYCSGLALEREGALFGVPQDEKKPAIAEFFDGLFWLLEAICLSVDPAVIQIGGGLGIYEAQIREAIAQRSASAAALVKKLAIPDRLAFVRDSPVVAIGSVLGTNS
jgi:glucokinase